METSKPLDITLVVSEAKESRAVAAGYAPIISLT